MKGKFIFYGFLFFTVIILFGFLYFLGIMNLLGNSVFLEKYKWLEFPAPIISIFYIIAITIFFILIISIMSRIIISLKQESPKTVFYTENNDFYKNLENQNRNNYVVDIEKTPLKSIEQKDEKGRKKDIDEIRKIEEFNNNIKIIEKNIANDTNIEKEIILEERINNYILSVSEMINDISCAQSIIELFERVLNHCVKFSKSNRASIMIADKNRYLYIYKTIGWGEEENNFVKEIKVNLGDEICGKAADTNTKIIVSDIEEYKDHKFKYTNKYKTNSFACLPFFGLNRVVAVVNLTDSENGEFSSSELEIVESIIKLGNKIFENLQSVRKD